MGHRANLPSPDAAWRFTFHKKGNYIMQLEKINISELKADPFDLIGKKWALLTSGNVSSYNTMTVSWGHMGVMWGSPSAIAFVRTNRHTFSFMEKNDLFTLSFFDEKYRSVLNFCGSRSGRDCDKAKETGITPIELGGAAAFAEASLVIVCKKQYSALLDPDAFCDREAFEKWYSESNPIHKEYIGKIISVYTAKDSI